ncbi:hypothetical protein LCGC14_0364150 [marine sediment metagenome]|uniref:Uncharacterized protein n=1 Tax=marine sediment metagenome TaxID=412755 RepID=A0A0F9VUD1_9ZZZZ
MLTKEQLAGNLAALEEQLSDLTKDTHAVIGAIQNCHYLIGLCDAEPEEESSDSK